MTVVMVVVAVTVVMVVVVNEGTAGGRRSDAVNNASEQVGDASNYLAPRSDRCENERKEKERKKEREV